MADISTDTVLTGTVTEAQTITAANVTVSGPATVDGQDTVRPMFLNGQNNVTILDLTLINGSTWCLYTDGSDGVTLEGVTASDPVLYAAVELDDTDNISVSDCTFSGSVEQHGITCVASTASTSGVRITDSVAYNNADKGIYAVGIGAVNRVSNVLISGCEAYNNGDGFYLIKTINAVFRNNISRNNTDITDVGEGYGIGVSQAPGTKVLDNIIHDNRTDGVEVWGGDFGGGIQDSDDSRVLRNLIYDQSNAEMRGIDYHTAFADNSLVIGNCLYRNDRQALLDGASANNTFAQNTCVGGRSAIRMERADTVGWSIYNNILVDFTQNYAGLDGANTGADVDAVSHNLYRQASSGTLVARLQGVNYTTSTITNLDAGAITADPSFRHTASDDYRLNGDSPCIAAGAHWWTGEPPQGQDGRRFCSPPSMGAYEYYGGGRAGAIPARVKPAGVDIAKGRRA